ncbi:MAG: bifunctional folylpolyglutamate synthase/dihydrofolate synthase [Bacteroidales bacterium]|jgi:dihydrofolate synthase/folylpolyglutamate synthase|nr:bifunctional folylpolyglutamate synthase/dihydrofolate synthase [Bacteroidales bacterium]
MNYNETIEWLFARAACYQKVGSAAYKPDLNNTLALLETLDNPHKKLRCIHIAGTNGKGSTSHLTASILQEAGYTVGLYTSPHLLDFRERIKINGENIDKRSVTAFVKKIAQQLETIQPSFFEITVALAFDYFAKRKVDYAVIEVGLGGRLDSTNVIEPLVSVITNIGLDHTNLLGNTLEEIAGEKAGIIKPNTPCIIGEQHDETEHVFEDIARKNNAPLLFASIDYAIKSSHNDRWHENFSVIRRGELLYKNLQSELQGTYQRKNICTVAAVCDELIRQGVRISSQNFAAGLARVVENTGLMGRWHIVHRNPLVVCDTAHNADGIAAVMQQLIAEARADIHIVWGMVNDKDVTTIVPLLPQHAQYYITQAHIERALDAHKLAEFFSQKNAHVYHSVADAYNAAIQNVSPQGIVYVGGSTFIVAEFLCKFFVK